MIVLSSSFENVLKFGHVDIAKISTMSFNAQMHKKLLY